MSAPKIYVSPSNQSGNPYATGGTNERAQCAKIAKACVAYLQKAVFSVKCTYADDMVDRVRESNAFGADVHLAIHTNATPKHTVTGGTQVLLYIGASCFPMPGASGASEGTFYLAFSPLFGDYLTTAMLIWRLASYYLTIVLGYIAVVAERVTLRHAQQ